MVCVRCMLVCIACAGVWSVLVYVGVYCVCWYMVCVGVIVCAGVWCVLMYVGVYCMF